MKRFPELSERVAEDHPRPTLTVDVVPLTVHERHLKVLLARRDQEPFSGRLALIGGYVHVDEDRDLEATARRVLRQKAGIRDLFIEQLMTFSGRRRDPRGWSATVAYFSLTPPDRLTAAIERGFEMVRVDRLPGLPFDHGRIVEAAIARLRGKGAYSDLPARLLPGPFTLGELHNIYELVLGDAINEDAFRRKIMDRGFVEELPGEKRRTEGARKPAQLYRLKPGLSVFDRRL
jgi:ADP-ribose pyrophosphatase YjhB (NUDIX family)